VRAGAASTIVAVFLAGGLTAWGNPSLESLCKDRAERIECTAATWAHRAAAELKARFGEKEDTHRPGPTCALVVSGDFIVGVDSDGYVTCRETSFNGDLAALTGFTVDPDSIGERLSMPELVLGLSIVRAFDRPADMPDILSEVHIEDLENPRVVLCGGVMVEIGAGDYRTKIARLRQVLLQAPELGIRPTGVDMRFGPQVVVEFEKAEEQPRKEV
jgi:hypothetical protein